MEEIIKDAKHKSKTKHITFFDLEDAFGSVPHSLIQTTLENNFIPENIRLYFHNFYSQVQPVLETKSWRSNPFSLKRGVFQGDPISPIIFILMFNPILQDLQNQSHKGHHSHTQNGTPKSYQSNSISHFFNVHETKTIKM